MSASWAHTVHAFGVLAGLVALVALLRPDPALIRLRRDAGQGRLVEAAVERVRAQAAPVVRHPLVAVAAASSVAAAWIHASVAGSHLSASSVSGGVFGVLAVVQTAWAVAVLRHPVRRLLLAGAGANAVVAAGWLVTRTTGVPWDGLGASPVGVLDVLATAYELVVVGCCVLAARSRVVSPARLAPRDRRAAGLAMTGTMLLALAGL